MKLLGRKRKPSLKTLLGVTKAKRQVKQALGVYKVTKVINAPQNAKRRMKRRLGLDRGIGKFVSQLLKSIFK